MALFAYRAQVQSLLDDAGAVEYTVANLDTFINDARVQIAGASESIRSAATLNLVAAQQTYNFSDATGLAAGVAGVLVVRMVRIQNVGGGWNRVTTRPWEYFFTFRLCSVVPVTDTPTMAAQLNPGVNGTLWFDPTPDQAYVTSLDAVGYPIPLVTDLTTEALSAPWTEAVQYYAAYLALLNAQRRADADAMWQRYELFQMRATQMTTPSRLARNRPGGEGARMAGQHTPLTGPFGGQR